MGYKMRSSKSSGFGEWINVNVVFNADKTKIKATTITAPPTEYKFPAKDVPELFMKAGEPGEWSFKLSEDKKSVQQYRPYSGLYKAKFVKFTGKEGEKPTPVLVKNKNPEWKDYLAFTSLLEITRGKHKGLQVSYKLRYNFVNETDEDGVEVAVYKPQLEKSIHTQALDEFLEVTGVFDKGRIKWSDNLLPLIEKRILSADNEFSVLFKQGWVSTLFADDNPNAEPEDDPTFKADEPDEED